jgi:glycosyltransferase involved in cell wall biosynthesis
VIVMPDQAAARKNLKILFVHNGPQRFVVIDRDLLAERYTVQEWFVKSKRIDLLGTLRAVQGCDVVFCWFASWFSFAPIMLARLLGKRSILVTGGYDTASIPEAGYGLQSGGLSRRIARMTIANAQRLIVNSHFAQTEAIQNAGADPAKITVIYHGFETTPVPQNLGGARERIAVNVGGVRAENMLRKGLLPFVQAAALLPDVQFVQAGGWYDDSIETLKAAAGPNVTIKGFISDEDLTTLYAQASVYVQPSLHEAFGMSLAEAMLAGCIPVAARVGAIPEVLGETGVFTASNSPADIAAATQQALALDEGARARARDQIVNNFPMDRRRQALYKVIDGLD